MAFGIDTFRSHLDLINYTDFRTWNGATLEQGVLVGGKPLFAGRNFLGGDFIWGHAEATNASSEPDGAAYPLPATQPSPEHPENLTLFVDRVAPIQAPQPARQRIVGDKGRLFGRIDADALCNRLQASIFSGEFRRPQEGLVYVWLSVDPTVPFSADYWAGWADQVNQFHWSQFVPVHIGGFTVPVQPFRACILCDFSIGITQKLQPSADVMAAIATGASRYRGTNTTCYALWADRPANPPVDRPANPPLDWNSFSGATMPLLWRFWRGFRNDAGVVDNSFDVDATNPIAGIQQATDFMLEAQRWQPNVPSIQNPGFSNSDAITVAQATCLQTTDLPGMNDNNFSVNRGHFFVPGGKVKVIGRYIRTNAAISMSAPEARRISDAGFSLFTIWQSHRVLAGVQLEPRAIAYFNPDTDGNPVTRDDAGTLDGTDAFRFCGTILKQPPQTPVFFAIDFDPYDPPGPLNESWIRTYFENIKAARDDFSIQTGRHYLIGVYGVGRVLQLLYEQGIVSFFWQALSNGRSGSRPPRWPWYHANRWQYQGDKAICGIGGISASGNPFGIDPDVDWGDGGAWSLADPLSRALIKQEVQEVRELFLGWPFPVLVDLEP